MKNLKFICGRLKEGAGVGQGGRRISISGGHGQVLAGGGDG